MDSQSPPNEVVQNISVAGKLAGLTGAGASNPIFRHLHRREIDDGMETNHCPNSISIQSNSLYQELVHIDQELAAHMAQD